ncbi:taste receptor type 2 member 20-like [Leptodactylus fuscus]|uniref:taste receptor type 2 member 20-like n=1 Tax=Leptodactylus fuscus TaxID=238119 RepID=UPI003F4EFEEB
MALIVIFMAINFVAWIVSFPGNFFIVAVTILGFCKNRKLPLSDQLIFGITFYSLLHGLLKTYAQFNAVFEFSSDEYNKQAIYITIYLDICTLWFSALLSIHFCLKIVNIKNGFYIRLQGRFPKLFPWITVTFVLGYFFLSLYSVLDRYQESLLNATSAVLFKRESSRWWLLVISMTICVLCSLLCSVSALTILISLCKHIKRIQEHTEGSGSPNMDVHIRAIKTVSSLLAANILILICLFILPTDNFLLLFPFGILVSLCHTFNSYFLIKGTKKLDKAMIDILSKFTCFSGQDR